MKTLIFLAAVALGAFFLIAPTVAQILSAAHTLPQ